MVLYNILKIETDFKHNDIFTNIRQEYIILLLMFLYVYLCQ